MFRGLDAAGGFHPDADPGFIKVIADRFEHHERHRHRGGGRDFAGRRLDEIGAGAHGDFAGDSDVVVGLELASFENHFEVGGAARFLGRGDFIEDAVVIAGEELAAVDHHVDFIRAIAGRAADFLEFQL